MNHQSAGALLLLLDKIHPLLVLTFCIRYDAQRQTRTTQPERTNGFSFPLGLTPAKGPLGMGPERRRGLKISNRYRKSKAPPQPRGLWYSGRCQRNANGSRHSSSHPPEMNLMAGKWHGRVLYGFLFFFCCCLFFAPRFPPRSSRLWSLLVRTIAFLTMCC